MSQEHGGLLDVLTARPGGEAQVPAALPASLAASERSVCVLTFRLCSLNDDLSGSQIRRLKGLSVRVASGVVSIYKYFNRTFIPS